MPIVIGCFFIIILIKIPKSGNSYSSLLSFIVILFSGERTAFINFTMICLLLIMLKIIKLNKISISFIFSFLIIFIILVSNSHYINDRFIQQNLESKHQSFQKYHFLIIIFYIILQHLTYLKNLVIGSGPNMFRFECSKDEYIVRGTDFYELPPKYKYDGTLTKKQIKSNAAHARLSSWMVAQLTHIICIFNFCQKLEYLVIYLFYIFFI